MAIDEKMIEYYKGHFEIKPLSDEAYHKIAQKLYPRSKGFITGISNGLLFCLESGRLQRTFFLNSDEMPLRMQVYDKYPDGEFIIRKIYDPDSKPKAPDQLVPPSLK
jgi:hypothetical protein